MPGLVIPKLFLLARSESAYLSVWVLLADLKKNGRKPLAFYDQWAYFELQ